MTKREIAVRANEQGLYFPLDTTFDDWWGYRDHLTDLRTMKDRLEKLEGLYLIDWIEQGFELFGEEASQSLTYVEEEFGWMPNTYAEYARIRRDFPPDKRKPGLGITMYQAVLTAPPKLRDDLLELASKHNWSRDTLRTAVKNTLPEEDKPTKNLTIKELRPIVERLLQHVTPSGDHYAAYADDVRDLAELLNFNDVPDLTVLQVDAQDVLDV